MAKGCLWILCGILAAALTAQAQLSLQEIVDNSEGSVITVPPGEYQGPVRLKEGVLLVGAGAGETVLNVPDNSVGVFGENMAGIVGFTIRGGQFGVRTLGRFMGIFECRLEGQSETAILFEGGSGVAANNVIQGNLQNKGIVVMRANPVIAHNVIAQNAIGVHVGGDLIPSVQDNWFIGNDIAVLVEQDARVFLARNTYDGNRVNVQGADLGAGDQVASVTWDGSVPVRGGTVEQYINLMTAVRDRAFEVHPCVIYGLGAELGAFDVVILSPSATFSIGASAPDTIIQTHYAYDSATDAPLASSLRVAERPYVDVVNPDIKDMAADRYVLENRYWHPPSYQLNEQGQRVFRRMTNLNRIEVFCPPGWLPVSVNYPAEFAASDGQIVIKILHPGVTQLSIVMEPVAASSDPLNLRGLLAKP